jgi:hypothetical protein
MIFATSCVTNEKQKTAAPAVAQQQAPFVYPAKGQTPDQQAKDEFACFQWAREQTGYDPARPIESPQQPRSEGTVAGRTAFGAAAGAVGGALVGGLFGRPGRGAAIGAASGGLYGGVSQSKTLENERQADRAVREQNTAALSKYFRAFSTCMNGRGYTVS